MGLGLVFWILMLLWLALTVIFNTVGTLYTGAHYAPIVNFALLFTLFLILGWAVFGPPVRGSK